LNKGNLAAINKYFTDDFVCYTHDGKIVNKATYKLMMAALMKTFPDVHGKEEGIVADEDTVALRFATIGTDSVGREGKLPTGKVTTLQQAYFMRFSGGKINEVRSYYGVTRID
jgi:predicted ester cyclase